jgi:hypothetical protein
MFSSSSRLLLLASAVVVSVATVYNCKLQFEKAAAVLMQCVLPWWSTNTLLSFAAA